MYNAEKSFKYFERIDYQQEEEEVEYSIVSVIFFFGMTVIFSLIKYALGKFKYSPPNEPIFAIIGIAIGRVCRYLTVQTCIQVTCKKLSEWIIVVVPVMYYKVCYSTEFSRRNSKILIQALFFGILGSLISSVIIGINLKIIDVEKLTLETALMLGLFCVPVYPTGSKELRSFGSNLSHVGSLLDGEALVGTVTVFFFLEIVMKPLVEHSSPAYFLRYTLHLVVGSVVGWISGMTICRLMVKFSDLPTTILIICFVPLIVGVFVHVSGYNEDLTIIVQVLMISKNRTYLRKDTRHFYGQFINLMYNLINDMTLVYVGILIGEQFTIVQLFSSIPYIVCMYIVVISGRFFSFAVLSWILNKCKWGLSLPQLILVIWCGVPSMLNVLILISIHRSYGFPIDEFGMVMTRNLGELVILGYIINTWSTPLILSCLGFIHKSLAKDVNMDICFLGIMRTRQISIMVLKLQRWYCDAHWVIIKNNTELIHPHGIIRNDVERDKEIFRFAVCNHCDLEFFVPPTFKEYQEMTREARGRVLKSKKNFYLSQYNIGMLSEKSYKTLNDATEKALESSNVEFDTNELLNMIRKVNLMDDNSHSLRNTYEYRFKMMYAWNTKGFRRFVMNIVIHPVFDQAFNFVALLNLSVDIYFLVTFVENRSIFLTVYGCFFGVYSFEIMLKLYFFSIRRMCDGIFNFFRSAWNAIDAILLLMTCFVIINTFQSVHYKAILIGATLSKLRIIRILRLFQPLKYCKSMLSLLPNLYGDFLAARAYETGKTFIKGEQELMHVVPGMVKDPNITSDILKKMDEDIMLIAREIEQIQKNRPQVTINIKTKQAIRTVLNFLNEEIDYMKIAGWVDEIEYKLLLKSVYERYLHLHSLRTVKVTSARTFFEEISWLNNDQSLKEYLYNNLQTRTFSSEDLIIDNGEHSRGVYIVVSGLLRMEYEPDHLVLEQLESYGALPVVDFITGSNFRETRRDFIVAGNSFGELSVLTGRPYACNITADSPCELMFIGEDFIRSAMESDNDAINGNLTFEILLNARPYRTTPADQVRQCLDRSFLPKLNELKTFTRNERIEDMIVIDGAVLDEDTQAYFIAPRHLPRSVQKISLPGSSKYSLDTRILPKLILITMSDVELEYIMTEQEFNEI
ncbi:sodium/hydrogen exchanger 10-like isoform X2 [Harmonia axyridis]|uniref:sodium/hydrogen exchanger 10-like isoform X2 n=1 Tax=Harmonia axyridis TaxID=115357 RepID=UPI001E275478|nr:sodium/hydrogen exchanger 10-like isoform X2 [Harmonia axyridis]